MPARLKGVSEVPESFVATFALGKYRPQSSFLPHSLITRPFLSSFLLFFLPSAKLLSLQSRSLCLLLDPTVFRNVQCRCRVACCRAMDSIRSIILLNNKAFKDNVSFFTLCGITHWNTLSVAAPAFARKHAQRWRVHCTT